MEKTTKITDRELWILIEEKIKMGDYLFLPHAKQRQIDRDISDLEVLDILENKHNCKRKRNKRKDSYRIDYNTWNYCVEGLNGDEKKIRIIVSFEEDINLLIVTVIKL